MKNSLYTKHITYDTYAKYIFKRNPQLDIDNNVTVNNIYIYLFDFFNSFVDKNQIRSYVLYRKKISMNILY